MALTAAGLPNGGATTRYTFLYDDSLGGAGGIEPARTTQLMSSCDGDFSLMQGWFSGVSFPFSTPVEVHVNTDGGTASWGPPIQLNSSTEDAGYLRMLLIAEVTEMFMMSQAAGWFPSNEGSLGEGLSRFLAEEFLIGSGLGLGEFPSWGWTANSWLQSPTQPDWVNNVDPTGNLDAVETGCSILFIYYLFTQLNFSINQIIAAAASNLVGVYTNLTQDTGDPFPFFKALLQAYPGPGGISTGPNLDDPFPVGLTSIWVEKSTFGLDEVGDVIQQSGGTFSAAFWVVVEGFSKNSFNALGISVSLDGSLTTTNGITVSPSPSSTAQVDYEDAAKPNAPQRIRIPYDITFTHAADSAFPQQAGDPSAELELHVELKAGGNKVAASDAWAAFELVAGADPYFTNVDPAQGNVFYLSQDLRVFTATPALDTTPVAGGPTFSNDSFAGGYEYIQALLGYLNANPAFTNGSQDPFANFPDQIGAFTGDSSVTPNTGTIPLHSNYNFAVARVRLRGTAGGPAQSVRVFFRLWSTQTADTDYHPSTTYTSTPDAAGLPGSPLVGVGTHTIPFFATGNLSSNTDYAAGGMNNKDIVIASGDTAWHYFGCFVNVYDASNVVNGQQIQQWLNGTHHCLVAQIACDSAPIPTGASVTPSPENSDKLAQRNLQITSSDNPGGPKTHRIPQTFDVRPTRPAGDLGTRPAGVPDELMIDWGNVPSGSVASIYWPKVAATDVLELADKLYSFHALSAADNNTLQCVVTDGVTYVPIPANAGDNYAGLLTIDLPLSVVAGEEFDVVVRRVVTTQVTPIPVPKAGRAGTFEKPRKSPLTAKEKKAAAEAAKARAEAAQVRIWRFVAGAFRVKIPVRTGESLLPSEENTLAIMKWRLQVMAPSNRWYPVLQRYVGYLAGRVRGLGGDPDQIPASLEGAPVKGRKPKPYREAERFVGTVIEIRYDCFGAFSGFVLSDCCDERAFSTRDPGLAKIILKAFCHGLTVAIIVSEPPRRILEVLFVR